LWSNEKTGQIKGADMAVSFAELDADQPGLLVPVFFGVVFILLKFHAFLVRRF